ncbi:unnamed protein product [Ectocarpus sp. 6 AP-2014]
MLCSATFSRFPPALRHEKRSLSSFSNKRARVSPTERGSFCSSYDGSDAAHDITTLPTVPETPTLNGRHIPTAAGGTRSYEDNSFRSDRGHGRGGGYPRAASPTPSYASSSTTFSAATTSATALSSRASLSSCRSSFTCPSSSSSSSYRGKSRHDRGSGSSGRRSSYASSRPSSLVAGGGGGVDYFPKPSVSWSGGRRNGSSSSAVGGGVGASWRRRDSSSRRDRCSSRERHFFCPPPTRRSSADKDYASEASSSRKRNRSCSRERGSRGDSRGRSSRKMPTTAESRCGVECARCLEWCRPSRSPKTPIPRTLQMDYWVRTPNCKAAKSKHIDFIDDVAYSREQFIEETVFTCPFTGARRDIVLERNMFPYDVPTDVEHWTLWSRRDLPNDEMEAFVQGWAAEKHPHAVEWECDNNEGERSIDWFHVHVFFRLGCEDRTGVPRDPASVNDGPCGSAVAGGQDEDEEGAVVVGGGADDDGTSTDRDDGSCAVVVTDCE